jgi:hypothetical protein
MRPLNKNGTASLMSRRSRKFEMNSRHGGGLLVPSDKVAMKKQKRREELQAKDLADLQKLMDEAAKRDATPETEPTTTKEK